MAQTMHMTTVPSADDMDDATFAKHMTHRHGESLGGLPFLHLTGKSPSLVAAWRAFHRRLHNLAEPGRYEHTHLPGERDDQTGPMPVIG